MSTNTVLTRPAEGLAVEEAGADTAALPAFQAGDIVLFAGRGDLYSRVSRWIMRTGSETPTYAVHTAQFIYGGRYLELDIVGKTRPTSDIFKRRLSHDMWQRRGFEIWHCRTLTPEQRAAVTQQALTYLGAKFGMAKFSTHLLDGLINKALGRDIFFFRRLNHDTRYPICSWITAFSYDRALGYRFGVPPECADPDQIADWVSGHPGEWERVFQFDAYAEAAGAGPTLQ